MQPMFLYSILLMKLLMSLNEVRSSNWESEVVCTGRQRVVRLTPGWSEVMKKVERVECNSSKQYLNEA